MNTIANMIPVLAAALVSAIWQSALLALSIAICLRLLPGITAAARSVVWTTAFLLMTLLPLAHLHPGNSPTATSVPGFHVEPVWAFVLAGMWALLSVLRAAQLLHSALQLYGISSRAISTTPPDELAVLLATAAPNLRLCTSSEVDVPSVAGFFRPRILLPATLAGHISAEDLHQIVLHELEHLRRRDDWTNLFQKLALVLFPLNPALVWVERRLCLERELACDDRVLSACGCKPYATCLVNLAQHGLLRRGVSLALAAIQRPSELARRVHRILRSAETTAHTTHPLALATCLAAAIFGTGFLAVEAPQLVSFAAPSLVAKSVPTPALPYFRATVAHATLPSATSAPVIMRVAATHHRPHRRPGILRTTTSPYDQPRRMNPGVVLIDWRPTQPGPRWTVAQQPSFVLTYAAVPTSTGWLFFQL